MSNSAYLLIFFALGLAGMFFNFAAKKATKSIDDTLFEYVVNRPWRSVSSLGVLLAALASSLFMGADFTDIKALAGAFMAGFGVDKLINKGK